MPASAAQLRNLIHAEAKRIWPQLVQWRRTIHQEPELAWKEAKTSRLVREALTAIGIPYKAGIGNTGVIATLETDTAGPTIVLRADMDALPIHEATGLPFASRHAGLMHACGHDLHTASLLGTAAILHSIRDDLRGATRFVFQPAEEKLPGGALSMIRDGVLDLGAGSPPPMAFAQHVLPNQPVGSIGVRPGAFMASADEIYLTIQAQGGHAAMPHRLEADAVLMASHIVIALQSVISRNCPPDVPSVLSFGKVAAEGASNVMPEAATLEGTFRSMDETWRYRAHDLVRRVATHTARAFGGTVDVDIRTGYPALVNDAELARDVRRAAFEYVGERQTVDQELWFASEDFAYFLQQTSGVFYTLGVGQTAALHTSTFDPDESALRTGSGFMAYLAWRQLWA